MHKLLKLVAALPAVAAVILKPASRLDSGSSNNGLIPADALTKAQTVVPDEQRVQTAIYLSWLSYYDREEPERRIALDLNLFDSVVNCGFTNATLNGQHLNPLHEWKDGAFFHAASGAADFIAQEVPVNDDTGAVIATRRIGLAWQAYCHYQVDPSSPEIEHAQPSQRISIALEEVDDRLVEGNAVWIKFHQAPKAEILGMGFPLVGRFPSSERFYTNDFSDLQKSGSSEATQPVPVSNEISKPKSNHLSQHEMIDRYRKQIDLLIGQQKEELSRHLSVSDESQAEPVELCQGMSCIFKALIGRLRAGAHQVCKESHSFYRQKLSPKTWWKSNFFKSSSPPDQMVMSFDEVDGYGPSSTSTKPAVPTQSRSLSEDDVLGEPFVHGDVITSADIALDALVISFLLGSILMISGTFVVFLHRRCIARRRKALTAEQERRALERRATRARRRITAQLAWSNWWRGVSGQGPRSYDEKVRLTIEQEAILEAAMQDEIRQLRHAHETASSIVQAEEGHRSSPITFSHRNSMTFNGGRSRVNSLPSYRSDDDDSDPPPYDSDDDSGDRVANGFSQYSPSGGLRGLRSAASSLFDVSPRLSQDTWASSEFMYEA